MKKNGFTLIEFLIVLSVIIIIMAFLIPSFTGVFDEKKITEAEGTVELLKVAIDNYYRNYHSYPNDLGSLTLAQPQILEVLPSDPYTTAGNNYSYVLDFSTSPTYYVVYSQGPNGSREWLLINGEARKLSGDDILASNAPVLR